MPVDFSKNLILVAHFTKEEQRISNMHHTQKLHRGVKMHYCGV